MAVLKRWVQQVAPRYAKRRIALRDIFLLGGLAFGLSPYSLKRRSLEIIDVGQLLNERAS
jgi:hypothetical protein